MYYLGDLRVLATLVEEASKHMPDITATSPDPSSPDEDIIAGTLTIPDRGPSESTNMEE